jgi:mannose-6-phosphate isomerase-like protein (cupin superfamily)
LTAPHVTPWPASTPPTEATLRQVCAESGLSPYAWSNGPYDVYAAHTHGYAKVIYVVQGSITFELPQLDQQLTLHPGDRLDLPAGTVHAAVVGAQGVVCLEAHN